MTTLERHPLQREVNRLLAENERLREEIRFLKDEALPAAEGLDFKLRRRWPLLTSKPRELLAHLYAKRGAFLTKEQLHTRMYAHDPDGGPALKIIDAFVSKARKQIGYGAIETLSGVGLRLSSEGQRLLEEVAAQPPRPPSPPPPGRPRHAYLQVLDVLAASCVPLSVTDLRRVPTLNGDSIGKHLEMLCKHGLAEHVGFGASSPANLRRPRTYAVTAKGALQYEPLRQGLDN